MSKFRERLNQVNKKNNNKLNKIQLFIEEFGTEPQSIRERIQLNKRKNTINNESNNKNNLNTSFNNSFTLTKPKRKDSSSSIDTLSRSFSLGYKSRKISSNVLDKSAISPFYIDKSSFNYINTDSNRNLYNLRTSSANKYKNRIRKEIDDLSKNFRSNYHHNLAYNRPLAWINRPKNENFSINYVSTLSEIRDFYRNKQIKQNRFYGNNPYLKRYNNNNY